MWAQIEDNMRTLQEKINDHKSYFVERNKQYQNESAGIVKLRA